MSLPSKIHGIPCPTIGTRGTQRLWNSELEELDQFRVPGNSQFLHDLAHIL